MRLNALTLRNFRNLEPLELCPSPHATVIVGPNGQGKTNLLEAIFLLTTLRPLRAGRLSELVRFGETTALVAGTFELNGADRRIGVTIEEGTRTATVGGKPVRELDEYFGGVSVVAFTPSDLAIVKGGPEARRAFLDRAVFGRFPSYLAEHRSYTRALKARNRLLQENRPDALVAAFDGPLAKAGARMLVRRRTVALELQPHLQRAIDAATEGELQIELRYAPEVLHDAPDEATVEQKLLEALQARLPTDRARGFTSVGPHADRLSLQLDGRPARTYASQGQQRALVLALKIAELENLEAALGRPPLLLLDDVSSELDRDRNTRLMRYLRARRGQLLLTTTDPTLVTEALGSDAGFWDVRAGALTPRPQG